MSRDAESRGRRDMWSSVVNSSESKRGADMWGPLPGRLTDSPPPGMDDRRHQKSRSISPRGGRGRLRRYDINLVAKFVIYLGKSTSILV